MQASYLDVSKAKDISNELLLPNGKLKLLSINDYKNFDRTDLLLFCYKYARYGLPTIELIQFLKKIINGRSAIEIGAGHGDLGYHLQIPITDSKCQEFPIVKAFYELARQPVIHYPSDIEKFEALEAVEYYKPQVVLGSWITRWMSAYENAPLSGGSISGVKENLLIKKIQTYIMIGNRKVHCNKDILKIPHDEIEVPFIVSRASDPKSNCIYIWNNKL